MIYSPSFGNFTPCTCNEKYYIVMQVQGTNYQMKVNICQCYAQVLPPNCDPVAIAASSLELFQLYESNTESLSQFAFLCSEMNTTNIQSNKTLHRYQFNSTVLYQIASLPQAGNLLVCVNLRVKMKFSDYFESVGVQKSYYLFHQSEKFVLYFIAFTTVY